MQTGEGLLEAISDGQQVANFELRKLRIVVFRLAVKVYKQETPEAEYDP